MRYIKYLITILIGITFFQSCIKTLDNFDVETEEPKIVLNAVLDSDTIFKIHVSRSIGVLENERLYVIPNANVMVYKNDELLEVLNEYNNGFYYKSGFKPSIGVQYRIVVEADGYQTVESDVVVPQKPEILGIDTRIIHKSPESSYDQTLQVTLSLKNPPEQKNYFMIEVKKSGWIYTNMDENFYDSVYYYGNTQILSEDPKMEIMISDKIFPADYYDYEYWVSKYIFTDQLMNDDEGTVTFELATEQIYNPEFINGNNEQFDIFDIILTEISKDFYLYLKSLSLYTDDVFENFFIEKATVYTNVSEGIGIIAAQSSTVYTFQRPPVSFNVKRID